MSNITLASKGYVTGETEVQLTLASKEYVDSKVQSYPENSIVFFYKDNDGKIQGFDTVNATNGGNLFKDNQNINVDWTLDMPKLEKSEYMFSGSKIKSFICKVSRIENYYLGSRDSMFENCVYLKSVDLSVPCPSGVGMQSQVSFTNLCKGCTTLTDAKLSTPSENPMYGSTFEDCQVLKNVELNSNAKFLRSN